MISLTKREIPIQFHIGVVCLSKTQCEHIKYLHSYLLAFRICHQNRPPKSDHRVDGRRCRWKGKSAELHNSNPSIWWSGRRGEGKRMRIVGEEPRLVMDSYGDGKPVMPCTWVTLMVFLGHCYYLLLQGTDQNSGLLVFWKTIMAPRKLPKKGKVIFQTDWAFPANPTWMIRPRQSIKHLPRVTYGFGTLTSCWVRRKKK